MYLNPRFASAVTHVMYQLKHSSVWVLDQWCLWPPRAIDLW